ncbi:MAG: ribosome silencing factor [Chlorobi bacterium]|nr:ribosome silencing factor [Chlorobiota bacterium]
MAKEKQVNESKILADVIVRGIQEKKGKDIVSLDFSKLPNAISKFFIICHGNSKTQVEAIAKSVEEEANKTLQRKPWQKEGKENAEWILIDFADVVVHIFQEETRMFYKLEDLWADAKIKKYESE